MQHMAHRSVAVSSMLDQLYRGPLATMTPPMVSSRPPPGALSLHDWLTGTTLSGILDRFAEQYRQGDRRAIASLWSKWHFSAVIAPALAANLLLERDLPIRLEQLHVLVSPQGRTERLCLRHEGLPLPSRDAFERFTTLIDHHLGPLIELLSTLSGASPWVFWSNAGNFFEYYVKVIEQHPMASASPFGEAVMLLDSRHYPDGRRNPLFRPVRYLESRHDEVRRVRKLCCLRYLLPELNQCGNCPLEDCDGVVQGDEKQARQ